MGVGIDEPRHHQAPVTVDRVRGLDLSIAVPGCSNLGDTTIVDEHRPTLVQAVSVVDGENERIGDSDVNGQMSVLNRKSRQDFRC